MNATKTATRSVPTRTAVNNQIATLQTEWREAMAEGRANDVGRIAGHIAALQRVRLSGISTRISLADISAAIKRMEAK